jgi:hypothetical protein
MQKPTQALKSVKGPENIFDLKPTAGCKISTLIFEKTFMEGGLYKYSMTNILRTAKFLPTWGLSQRYCPGF